jgi:hypothetical protein
MDFKNTDFTTKRHDSCTGCFFCQAGKYTCTSDRYKDLLVSLYKLFGDCADSDIIYILKYENGKLIKV